ncbi:MAG: endopeptidase IV [bacterium]|nr:endopeptidase IV [bacterium]
MKITKKGLSPISLLILCGFINTPINSAPVKKNNTQPQKIQVDDKETRFPTGCTPVGFEQSLKVLTLYPGKEGALQSMYFFYNKLDQPVSLYQMRDKESEYSTRFNHTIKGSSWAVLAVGEPKVKFICTLGDGKSSYGTIIDCGETIKVCEYVHVKFGLNNKGNFWIVDSNTRNGAVSDVVHYGIIPGV